MLIIEGVSEVKCPVYIHQTSFERALGVVITVGWETFASNIDVHKQSTGKSRKERMKSIPDRRISRGTYGHTNLALDRTGH